MNRSLPDLAAAALVVTLALPACTDKSKQYAVHAGDEAQKLAALSEKDCGEVERGLPEGAKTLASLFAKGADPRQDLPGVRTALKKVRRDNMDLNVAKSTFFALADDRGVAIRNDLDTDVMAGQNLLSIFPDLAKAQSGYVTTTGAFPGAAAAPEPDKDWIAAVPVKKDDGTLGGYFVTGWTYRYFARHLTDAVKSDLVDAAHAAGTEGKLPVYYIAVFDKSGVYTAPLTPDVNRKALVDLDLVGKTAAGLYQAPMTITDRAFGVGAIRVPKLGAETGVVILWSEI
jgi:hypothetical protein